MDVKMEVYNDRLNYDSAAIKRWPKINQPQLDTVAGQHDKLVELVRNVYGIEQSDATTQVEQFETALLSKRKQEEGR